MENRTETSIIQSIGASHLTTTLR